MRRFKSAAHAQRFLSVHGPIQNLFRVGRHLLQAVHHRLLRTRAFGVWREVTCVEAEERVIACGHPDANDAARLADDPIHKLLLGRDPITGDALASQPTISRFENHVRRAALYRLAQELAIRVVERHRRRRRGRARRITIDLDPTDDATHGAQQLTFFNGYYDSWCYLPLLAFVTFDDEAEQYLVAAVLRPGNVPATQGAVEVLRRVLALLRLAFPQARFLVRLDGGFATPEIFDVLDTEPGLDYVVAMAKNAVLVRHAEAATDLLVVPASLVDNWRLEIERADRRRDRQHAPDPGLRAFGR